jgi:hypothetical protein
MLLKSDFLVPLYLLLKNLHIFTIHDSFPISLDTQIQTFVFETASLLSGNHPFALEVSRLRAPSPDSTSLQMCAVSEDESEWVPAPGTPAEREWPVVVRPLLSLKRRPRFKIRLEKKKTGITVLARTRSNLTDRLRLVALLGYNGHVVAHSVLIVLGFKYFFGTSSVVLYRMILRNLC